MNRFLIITLIIFIVTYLVTIPALYEIANFNGNYERSWYPDIIIGALIMINICWLSLRSIKTKN